MKFLIEGYGYQVIEAADGLEAIKNFKSEFPDLVLMDIALPLVDGIEATKAIRESKNGAAIPIIALTAFGMRFYEKAIAAGCNDLIEKPIDFDSLRCVIDQYLGL